MPVPAITTKDIATFGGIDTRSNDINRPPVFARSILNFDRWSNSTEAQRQGYKGISKGSGGGGLATYVRVDPTTQQLSEELITISDKLYKLTTKTITISCSVSDNSLTIGPVKKTDGTYGFAASFTNSFFAFTFSFDLGTGIDTSSIYTVTNLVAAINATGGGWTASGSGSEPAAFLPNLDAVNIASTGTTITYQVWTPIYIPGNASPFATFWSGVNTANFENASMQNCDNKLFIATGSNELFVYDSHACYRAGMPSTSILSAVAGAAGALTGTYEYFITYEHDNIFNTVVEGDPSNAVQVTLAAQKGSLTIPYIKSTNGWYGSSAISSSSLAGVNTFNISAGHTIQIGDVIYFKDNAGAYQNRTVSGTTGTTVTFSGATSSIVNGYVISGGIIINIWRNAAGDLNLKYLVESIPNDGYTLTTTVTYTDNMTDATLIAQADYVPPTKGHGLPPANLKYLTVYNGLLCGATGADDDVWYSDYDGPQYFPTGTSNLTVRSKTGAKITGIGANRASLIATKANETHIITGDLPGANYRNERLSDAIGCSANATVIDFMSNLWFWSSTFGARISQDTGAPSDASYRVLYDFQDPRWTAKRAIAVNWANQQKIILFIPSEYTNGAGQVTGTDSKIYTCDYQFMSSGGVGSQVLNQYGTTSAEEQTLFKWRPWDNINAAGGMAIYGGKLYWMERRYGSNTSAFEYNLCSMLQDGTAYDYSDHAQPYAINYELQWMDGGEPSLIKKFIRARIYTLDGGVTPSFNCRIQTEKDYINGEPSSVDTLTFGDAADLPGWGTGIWGDGAWGAANTSQKLFEFKPTVARSIKLVLSKENAWCEQIRFSGIEVQLVPGYQVNIQRGY